MMVDLTESEAISLLQEYSPLVRSIARSACYSSASIDISDLCQVGDVAVLRAIKSYNPSCGTTIRSFVTRIVRQDIYNEAARFLGIFTVDHRVTSLAAKANKLYNNGRTDEEIACILSDRTSRKIDSEHIKDLRIAYNRRQHSDIYLDDIIEEFTSENTIEQLLKNVTKTKEEEAILKYRFMGTSSIKDLSLMLQLTNKQVYVLEDNLKKRIRAAIEEII